MIRFFENLTSFYLQPYLETNMKKQYILAIDQGTSSTKSIIFDNQGKVISKGHADLHTNYFDNGFVEQDPEEIFQNVLTSVSLCLEDFQQKGYNPKDIASCGISNQRETFVLWDKTGKALSPAVVWACKRSTQVCENLINQGQNELIKQHTGLIIDPYFSGTKLLWLLENNPDLKSKLDAKKLADPEFAKNGAAQLDFVYKNSDYYEKTHNRYPVSRLVTDVKLDLK